jgi:hypothetical protein
LAGKGGVNGTNATVWRRRLSVKKPWWSERPPWARARSKRRRGLVAFRFQGLEGKLFVDGSTNKIAQRWYLLAPPDLLGKANLFKEVNLAFLLKKNSLLREYIGLARHLLKCTQ